VAGGLLRAPLRWIVPREMQVRWRTLLAVALGLLLPLPIGYLLKGALYGGPSPEGAATKRFSPVLSAEERRRLVTFDRACRGSEDCEAPLGCLQDLRRFSQSVCIGSECELDSQCPEGQFCRVINTQGTGPLVRLCIATGVRKEGEACDRLPRVQEEACAQGLLCNRNYCGRPCSRGDATSCPAGFTCEEGPEGASCLPACEEGQCPDGQECVRFEGRFAACAQVKGKNCQAQPCPEGQECRIGYTPGVGEEVTMQCLTPCEEPKTICPSGSVCFYGYCSRLCEPKTEGTCPPGEECVLYRDTHSSEKLWLCRAR
jgi:hypothetical protein